MRNSSLPDLSFPNLIYGTNEIPHDLRRWVFKGGAGAESHIVISNIEAGGDCHAESTRLNLVQRIHEVLLNHLERGGSRHTLNGQIFRLKIFFRWADDNSRKLSLDHIASTFRDWTDFLLHRVRVSKNLSEATAYGYGSVVGWILDRVLERQTAIVKTTRLRNQKSISRAVGSKADKQNLRDTFALGHFLLDLADGLSLDVIWGTLPVHIKLRNGVELIEWSGYNRYQFKTDHKYPKQALWYKQHAVKKHALWEEDKTLRTRYPLVNLRIQAEMFMLMGQPAVNLAQAHRLRMDQWRYKASTHGYEVRTYKNRRFGPVVFEIYSAYKDIFERYLKWRAAIFANDPDGLLFPLLGKWGNPVARNPDKFSTFDKLKDACRRANVKYLPPGALRSTNVNWMLRRTQDPSLTAEEKQHSTRVLLENYEKPSQQRAMVQVQAFWATHDPAQLATGPGLCATNAPTPIHQIPPGATQPDCYTPSGCLFCTQQRDVDSFDYVWSLTSFRFLKSFELGAQVRSAIQNATEFTPVESIVSRITEKLTFIAESSAQRKEWVLESEYRIEEGRYHPSWSEVIGSM